MSGPILAIPAFQLYKMVFFRSFLRVRMSVLIPLLLVVHVAICLLMVLVVLMQRPRSEGLGAAFGGGMTENLFGAQTTHVLQKFTVYLGVAFFALTLLLAILFSRATASSTLIERELLSGDSSAPQETAPSEAAPTVTETPVVEEQTIPVPASNSTAPAAAETATSPTQVPASAPSPDSTTQP